MVTIATLLLYASYAVAFAVGLFQEIPPDSPLPPWAATLALALLIGLMAALTFAISRRRNWARILYAVLFAGGLLQSYATRDEWIGQWSASPALAVNFVFQTGASLVALILLFTPTANVWYRSRKR